MSAEHILNGDRVFLPKNIALMDTLGEQGGRDLLLEPILAGRIRRSDLFPEGVARRTPLEGVPETGLETPHSPI